MLYSYKYYVEFHSYIFGVVHKLYLDCSNKNKIGILMLSFAFFILIKIKYFFETLQTCSFRFLLYRLTIVIRTANPAIVFGLFS